MDGPLAYDASLAKPYMTRMYGVIAVTVTLKKKPLGGILRALQGL
jgi:hypothetical protein